MKTFAKILALGAALAVSAPFAGATILVPGQQLAPPDVFAGTLGTLLANETVPLNSLTFNASLTAAVYRGGTDSLCPTCLTFAYQVSDISGTSLGTGVIEDLTSSVFTTFTTDVGYQILGSATSLFAAGGINPCTVGRTASGPGAVVSFDFFNAATTGPSGCSLVPGLHTSLLLVETDATNFTTGLFSAIDGATSTVVAYAPAAATPEPSSLLLMGTGLVSAAGMLLRRRGMVA